MNTLADPTPRLWTEAARENPLAGFVAASSLVSPNDLITRAGDYLRTWRLEGIAFESADPDTIAQRHESKCNLLASLGGGQFALWEHRVQRRITDRLDEPPGPPFARDFDTAYAARACSKPFMSNELYFTLLYRPSAGMARTFQKPSRTLDEIRQAQADALAVMAERTVMVERMLRDFAPRLLGSYTDRLTEYSELAEFMGFLVNGAWRRVRAVPGPLYRILPTVRLSTGGECIELRSIDGTRYAACADIQEYVDIVEPGALDSLLYENCEFIETQSFSILPRRKAMKALKDQMNQLKSSEDVVQTQIEAMDAAMEGLGDGAFNMGEYHYSLMIIGDSVADTKRQLAKAVGAIGEATGITMVSVDLISDAAWYAQQPGNFQWRTREATLSSRAYAALASNHSFARGKRDGNPWGQAAMLLRTPSGQPYYLNLHASPDKEDSEDKKLPGNTLIVGVTGAGKTTLELAILAQTFRYKPAPRLVIFDKDRGCEIFIRALGGRYFTLEAGKPTGLNPFQRPATPKRVKAWQAIVRQCLKNEALPLMPKDERAIHEAVQAVARMPPEHRAMSTIRQNLPRDGENSLYERLGRWCAGGAQGWVFDEADDRLGDLDEAQVIGFDYTDFLDDDEVRPAVMMDLLGVMDDLIDGRRLIYVMAEFWKGIRDDHFADFALNKQKTIRKENGLGIFDTQSPSDVLSHPIGRTMVEQSVTKIFLPNPDAVRDEYVSGFGLTEAEFEIVKELRAQGGYRFLVKQNQQSTVCELDLSGMDDALTVLSGSVDNVALLDEVRATAGDDPAAWMPQLFNAVRQRQERQRRQPWCRK